MEHEELSLSFIVSQAQKQEQIAPEIAHEIVHCRCTQGSPGIVCFLFKVKLVATDLIEAPQQPNPNEKKIPSENRIDDDDDVIIVDDALAWKSIARVRVCVCMFFSALFREF